MGMFDYINYEMNCPQCGEKVNGFQSKDGPCALETLDFRQVNNFYASCDNCGHWIEFNFVNITTRNIDDYEMMIK
jgi:transcription elongation factor Elf1